MRNIARIAAFFVFYGECFRIVLLRFWILTLFKIQNSEEIEMKEKIEYRYKFVNGDVVELKISRSSFERESKNVITPEWLSLLIDLDRTEYNNEHTETRRHCSLNAFDREDNLIPMKKDVFEEFYEEETWNEMCNVLSKREKYIGDLYFRKGYTQPEIAKILRVHRSRITQIITKIRKKFSESITF